MSGASAVPSDEDFDRGIQEVGSTRAGSELRDGRIVLRRENWYQSSFPTELVTVRCRDGDRVLFCKHGDGYVAQVAGLQRGPRYEARVYAAIEEALTGLTPHCYGSFEGSHGTTLVLAFQPRALRVTKAGVEGLAQAAERLGEFHRRSLAVVGNGGTLNRYDREHFERWSKRFDRIPSGTSFSSSLRPIAMRRASLVEVLARAEPTIVHGELFPSNVLVSESDVLLVDWETAGIGPGELDLSALTIGHWRPDQRRRCESAYARGRWGTDVPREHAAVLGAATAYVCTLVADWAQSRGRAAEPWLDDELERSAALLQAL